VEVVWRFEQRTSYIGSWRAKRILALLACQELQGITNNVGLTNNFGLTFNVGDNILWFTISIEQDN
jgi:hypothetical protein